MGEFQRRLMKIVEEIGAGTGVGHAVPLIDKEIREAMRVAFPKMVDRSHEHFTLNDYKKEGIELIRSGFFDAYMYIWDIIEWNKKWLDDD